jgi:hypothetical protein
MKTKENQRMEKIKPIWEVRLGAIRGAIFENRNGDRSYYNVSLTRRYKQGMEYMTSTTFNGLADMVLVKQAVTQAVDWLAENEGAEV